MPNPALEPTLDLLGKSSMSLTLLLHGNDLQATRKFYESILGFDAHDSAEGTLTVQKQGSKLIFTSADLWQIPAGLSGTIYFTIPDADNYLSSIRGNANVAWPIQDMPHGSREFGIKDCNGYLLAFQQQV